MYQMFCTLLVHNTQFTPPPPPPPYEFKSCAQDIFNAQGIFKKRFIVDHEIYPYSHEFVKIDYIFVYPVHCRNV